MRLEGGEVGGEGGGCVHLDCDGGSVGWGEGEGGFGAVWVGEEVEAFEGVVLVEEGYEGCCEGVGGWVHGYGVAVVIVVLRGWLGGECLEKGIDMGVDVSFFLVKTRTCGWEV